MPELVLQVGILLFKLLDPHLQVLHLLTGANTQFLDNLDESPKTQDDHKRGDLLDDAPSEDVDEEAGDNDQGVEDVEP